MIKIALLICSLRNVCRAEKLPDFVVLLENNVSVTRGRYGLSVTDVNDQYVGEHLRKLGEWEQVIMDVVSEFTREGDVVWELGSHIGSQTIGLASLVGSKGRVHAFEPQREARLLLSATLALNGLSDIVHVHTEALGNSSDHGRRLDTRACASEKESGADCVDVIHNNSGAFSMHHQKLSSQGTVPVASLDALFSRTAVLDRGCPQLMKSDVEGMDLRMLAGAEALISKCRPHLLFETMAPRSIWPELKRVLIDPHPEYSCSWLTFRIFPPANRVFRVVDGLHETDARGPMSYNALCVFGKSPESLAPKAAAAGHLLSAKNGFTDLIYSGFDCKEYENQLKSLGPRTFASTTGIHDGSLALGALPSICTGADSKTPPVIATEDASSSPSSSSTLYRRDL